MNKNLEQAVQAAIEQIKTLPSDKIQILKAEFDKIHLNAISAEESWYKLVRSSFTEYEHSPIRNAFLTIGDLITIPRTGSLTILADAYEEDATDISFFQYQMEIKEDVYKLLGEI